MNYEKYKSVSFLYPIDYQQKKSYGIPLETLIIRGSLLQSGCESECGETPTEASEHTRTQTQTHTGFSRPVSNLVRQRRTTRGRVRVSGSVEEENVLGLKLKLTLACHARSQTLCAKGVPRGAV